MYVCIFQKGWHSGTTAVKSSLSNDLGRATPRQTPGTSGTSGWHGVVLLDACSLFPGISGFLPKILTLGLRVPVAHGA